jgi:hypothetical protein
MTRGRVDCTGWFYNLNFGIVAIFVALFIVQCVDVCVCVCVMYLRTNI